MDQLSKIIEHMSLEILALCFQVIGAGIIVLYVKDLTQRIVNFFKLRLSDFGRGTKVTVDRKTGWIVKAGFRNVEIRLSENSILLIPVDKFLKSSKIIHTNIPEQD